MRPQQEPPWAPDKPASSSACKTPRMQPPCSRPSRTSWRRLRSCALPQRAVSFISCPLATSGPQQLRRLRRGTCGSRASVVAAADTRVQVIAASCYPSQRCPRWRRPPGTSTSSSNNSISIIAAIPKALITLDTRHSIISRAAILAVVLVLVPVEITTIMPVVGSCPPLDHTIPITI